MHIKRFEAATLLEAIQRVKAELGPDALILSQRTVRRDRGFFGLLGRPFVEVTAAVDREVRRGAKSGDRVSPDPSWRSLEVTRALVEPLERELHDVRRAVESLRGSLPEAGVLAAEMRALRQAAVDLAGGSAVASHAAGLSARLLAAGVAPRHALQLAREAEGAEGDREQALGRILTAHLDRRLRPPRSDDIHRVELFVGPTGVGKTTTLAKLAARASSQKESISLVTTDAMRIGADAPLRGFAGRVGAPFHVAPSPGELDRTLGAQRASRVLVDTGGRSRTDPGAIPDLLECRAALGPRARVNLVLAATAKDEDLAAEIERYRPLEPDRIVVTKVDESRTLGNVVNLLLDPASPPLSWIADGQRVPEDLRVADPDDLAARLLARTA